MKGPATLFCDREPAGKFDFLAMARWFRGAGTDDEWQTRQIKTPEIQKPFEIFRSGTASLNQNIDSRQSFGVADGARTHDNRNHNPAVANAFT
jgi:hypothetical protein